MGKRFLNFSAYLIREKNKYTVSAASMKALSVNCRTLFRLTGGV
jgi:hypothetical protein